MLTWLMERQITAFEAEYDYDMSYAREMLAADPAALWTFSKVQALKGYRKDVPRDVYLAVAITGSMLGDCGPCTQLMVTMALREGAPREMVSSVVAQNDADLSDEVRLAVQFARASLAHSPDADPLRERIVERWGQRALISLAFALALSQIFPTVKYALGHGKACQRVVVEGTPINILKDATA